MKITPVKGTNDYLPAQAELRNYLQKKICETYEQAGFQRIATPIIEDIENLDKSEGGDNLNLIFKVMKRGEKLKKAIASQNPDNIADMGLRYDLTLPLSRYYANNRASLPQPFKVIQMDRVYRAERPQKGRLREFIQCDIDILGSDSSTCEIELIHTTAKALLNIGINNFKVKINDRRILREILLSVGFEEDQLDSVCISFDKLNKIKAEGVEADEDAVRYVAKAADGAMRDALSLLEQCISFYYGQRLTYEKVLDVLGAVDTQVFSKLLRLIIRCDVPGCVQLMDEISSQGRDLSQFVTDFIWYLRNLMLVQTADQSAQALEMTKENYEALREESKMVALSVLMRNIRICSELSNQLKFAVSKRVLIEMAIIKMMQPQMEDDIESLRVRMDQIEEKIASGSFVNNTEPQQSGSIFDSYFEGDAKQPVMQKAAQTVELSEAEYEDYQKISSEWKKLSHMQSGFMNSILMGTNISYDKAKGLCIVFTNKFNYELMLRQERMEELRQMLNKQYQKEFSITAKLLEAGEAMPRITRGSHIEGINMEIGVEDE